MLKFKLIKSNSAIQYSIIVVSLFLISTLCFYTLGSLHYKSVALILLLLVSINAMLFDLFPVLLSAFLSALIWNYFFIPPIMTFHIGNTEDGLMFMMYFVTAAINGVFTAKIRQMEARSRDKEEKDKSIKLYNTLINSLSHELRTPVSTIIGAVDTLKDKNKLISSIHQHELLSQIDEASLRLNMQIENLLNMSRLESGMIKAKLDWCDLDELIHFAISKIPPQNSHKIIYSSDGELPLFKLDRGLMEQVFHNILHNALQYTPSGTTIKIHASLFSEQCIITIEDDGPGFPESEIQYVFEKFYRIARSVPGGSGLGLSIVKGFIETHQGAIELKNKAEGGSIFTITMPLETNYINAFENE